MVTKVSWIRSMPRVAKEMVPIEIGRIEHTGTSKNPERHFVGGVAGLLLQVTPSGAKYWLMRITIGGKRKFVGIGAYPEVSLKAAREVAAAMRQAVREGRDPVGQRRANKAASAAAALREKTFRQVLDESLDAKMRDKS